MHYLNTKHALKTYASLCIIIIVNLLFTYKYLSRFLPYPGTVTLIALIFYIGIWIIKDRITISKRAYTILFFSSLAIFIIGSIFGLYYVHIESLETDRWSVITSFWDTFLNGEYAYSARSHMDNIPGPFPFYFILSFPFYFLGELGYFSLIGIVLFAFVINKMSVSKEIKIWALVFLLSSFFNFWEILTRSNILINSLLVLLLLIWFLKINKDNTRLLILNATCAGLLLSTRTIFIIPYLIVFLYALKAQKISFGKLVLYASFGLISFLITFVPFIIYHIEISIVENPFIVQSTFLVPFEYTLGFILLAIASVLLCKNWLDTFFYSGLILFISITIYLLYISLKSSFYIAYIESNADISYFIFCIPFFMFYLLKTGSIKQS